VRGLRVTSANLPGLILRIHREHTRGEVGSKCSNGYAEVTLDEVIRDFSALETN